MVSEDEYTFGTFNIMSSATTKYAMGVCKDIDKLSKDELSKISEDEETRYGIIIKLLSDSNLDIIFLQEVHNNFKELLNKSDNNIKLNYNKDYNGELAIFVKKEKFDGIESYKDTNIKDKIMYSRAYKIKKPIDKSDIIEVQTEKYRGPKIINETINTYFINLHIPTDTETRNNILEKINSISTDNNISNLIVAGDFNIHIDEEYSINNMTYLNVDKKYSTSYHAINCERDEKQNLTGTYTTKDDKHKSLDRIYVKGFENKNIGTPIKPYSSFTIIDNNKYIISNDKDFKRKGFPYCDDEKSNELCNIKYYRSIIEKDPLQWPSDHAMLIVTLIKEKSKLKASAQSFIPGDNQYFIKYITNKKNYEWIKNK